MRLVRRKSPFGFTLIELLVVIAIIALLIAILLPALGEARKTGRLALCGSNMKQMGTATHSYGADFQDRIFSFTWKKGERYYEADSDLEISNTSDIDAGAHQAVHIIRRRGDRAQADFPVITSWIPHIYYTHLVVQDYLQARLPEPMVACPEDWRRKNWQIDPKDKFDNGWWQPDQPPNGNGPPNAGAGERRWPYSSSYWPTAGAYDRWQSDWPTPANKGVVSQAGVHNLYNVPGNVEVGNLRLSDVSFSGNKVHFYDGFARHFGKLELFYGWSDAREPLLFFDSAVNIKMMGDGNPGWEPLAKASMNLPTRIDYTPGDYEPKPRSGGSQDLDLPGYVQWTRGGLKGSDFGTTEINTEN